MRSYLSFSILVMVLASGPMRAQECPTVIEVPLSTRQEWFELPGFPVDPARPNFLPTFAATPFARYLDPDTGEPYVTGPPEFQCDPADVRHAFILEKDEFLLGEPIIIEFRVWLDGPGEWEEASGGNYRMRGRDDNFMFLMRHEDGTWVPEVQPRAGGPGGGGAGAWLVTQEEGHSVWFALQRWCAITKPGLYDIYCIAQASREMGCQRVGLREALLDAGVPQSVVEKPDGPRSSVEPLRRYTGSWPEPVASPLAERIPGEVRRLATESPEWAVSQGVKKCRKFEVGITLNEAHVYAHGRIRIRAGSADELAVMLSKCETRAGAPNGWLQETAADAVRSGICFALQPDFLPVVERWLEAEDKSGKKQTAFEALLANPDRRALRILLSQGVPGFSTVSFHFPLARWPHVMPNLIELLPDPDEKIRTSAHELLRIFSGGYFAAADTEKPGPEIADAAAASELQRLWRNWWARNASGVEPFGVISGWGYIDHSGTFVLPQKWDNAGKFEHGYASVMRNDARYWIDRAGNEWPEDTERPKPAGLYPFETEDRWGYRDETGKEVIAPKFEHAYPFSEGLGVVIVDGRHAAIDATGHEVFRLAQGSIFGFSEGLAVYRLTEDVEGYVDMSGSVVIQPCYSSANTFSEGLAAVSVKADPNDWQSKSRYGYVDKSGRMVISPQFEEARNFKQGRAAVYAGELGSAKWGFVDASGSLAVVPQFKFVGNYNEDVASATVVTGEKDCTGFIDRDGNWLIEPKFLWADDFSEGLAAASVGSPFMRFDPKEYADEAQAAR